MTEEHPFGDVLGVACNRCNLKYSLLSNEPKIPVFLHNGSKYDFKLLIRELCQNSETQLKIIPRTSETFPCISFQNFQIINTYAHLPNSLSKLTDILRSGQERMQTTRMRTLLQLLTAQKRPLLLNSTSMQVNVHSFKCSNLGEYFEAYLILDVTLLAGVFENFRAINHKLYGLDVAKYLSRPSFLFDAMLLQTTVKLKLITDLAQYEYIQQAIRGGISVQYTRYAKANYATLLDYNETELRHSKTPSNTNLEYILEVDLVYPENLHVKHLDFPLAPIKKKIKYNEKLVQE